MNKPILHRKKIVVLNQDPKWRWLGSCQTHRHSAQEVAKDPYAGDSSLVDILDCSEHVTVPRPRHPSYRSKSAFWRPSIRGSPGPRTARWCLRNKQLRGSQKASTQPASARLPCSGMSVSSPLPCNKSPQTQKPLL
ncbi:hypothetical protein H1C71_021365 [Ictidomys tridecemlineatus]|nr:hypothetical protein H1C71_021365 [Ictidomys tridecemlineatus]